jgi:hypothetical protein
MPSATPALLLLAALTLLAACGQSPGARPATTTTQVIGALPAETTTRNESVSPNARGGAGPVRARARAHGPEVDRAVLVGRVRSVDRSQRTAIVDLRGDVPPAALANGVELSARDFNTLAQTGLLKVSRSIRDLPLGTNIVAGQPSPGDEVVWLVP